MAKTPSKIATAAAAITKNILGDGLAKPEMVKMPRAIHELHVSKNDVIPAGTVITEEIATLADLNLETIEELVVKGAVAWVDVLASAVMADAPEDDEA